MCEGAELLLRNAASYYTVQRYTVTQWLNEADMSKALLTVLLVHLTGCGGTTDPPIATTVTLSPSTLNFSSFGETQQLTATVLDQNGATISGASVTWESSGSSVASVSSSGLVTALADGTATITATSGSASGTAAVNSAIVVTACSAETGSVTANVAVTAAPVFAWGPDCSVAGLLVEHAVGGAGGDVWFIQSSPTLANLISPPITYGATSLPAGVETSYGPDPLVRGTSYTLILFRIVDPAITTCTDLFPDPPLTVCRLVIHEFTW